MIQPASHWRELFYTKSNTDPSAAPADMEIAPIITGSITGRLGLYIDSTTEGKPVHIRNRVDQNITCPTLCFLVHHPLKGDFLIDAGFSKSFYTHPPYGNLPPIMQWYQKKNKVRYFQQQKGMGLEEILEDRKIKPKAVFLTHRHPDHTAGIPELPNDVPVYMSRQSRSLYFALITAGHLKGKKIHTINTDRGINIPVFGKAADLFNDRSLLAIPAPGHTKDHMIYLLKTADGPALILGDTELNRQTFAASVPVNTDYGKQGLRDLQETSRKIRDFVKQYPETQLYFSHDL